MRNNCCGKEQNISTEPFGMTLKRAKLTLAVSHTAQNKAHSGTGMAQRGRALNPRSCGCREEVWACIFSVGIWEGRKGRSMFAFTSLK